MLAHATALEVREERLVVGLALLRRALDGEVVDGGEALVERLRHDGAVGLSRGVITSGQREGDDEQGAHDGALAKKNGPT